MRQGICMTQGDAYENYYVFLDSCGAPLDNEIVVAATISIDRLKFRQELGYDEDTKEWRLFIPSWTSKNFQPFVGRYSITLTLCDDNNITVVDRDRIQVMRK